MSGRELKMLRGTLKFSVVCVWGRGRGALLNHHGVTRKEGEWEGGKTLIFFYYK